MASHFSFPIITLFLFSLISTSHSDSTPQLSSTEQESIYQILESINPNFDWRFTYPNDLCYSSPHGINCDYFIDEDGNTTLHVTEINLGYVSEYSPNPPCSSSATFSPSLTSLPYLRKLFFYQCFTEASLSLPGFFSNLSSTLEELIFIDNPSLYGTITINLDNLKNLKKLVFTGTNISGEIPSGVGELFNIEEIKLSRNRFTGEIPESFVNLKKLKILDLSCNFFQGKVPDSIGEATELFHLDLSSNQLEQKIPESLANLNKLEFLDLSYNKFANFGIPLLLGEMVSLKEVYLSGNSLGGRIPDIWRKLKGVVGIGLSDMGLVGEIPSSMGVFLRNVNYIRLDHNMLEGKVPEEFGLLEEALHELNLENNLLSGRLPFSAKFSARIGKKLKLAGNSELCVNGEWSQLHSAKLCQKPAESIPVMVSGSCSISPQSLCYFVFAFLLGALL